MATAEGAGRRGKMRLERSQSASNAIVKTWAFFLSQSRQSNKHILGLEIFGDLLFSFLVCSHTDI